MSCISKKNFQRCSLFFYFIPLGYNWIVTGKPRGTEARCDALLGYIREKCLFPERCRFLLTASSPTGSDRRSMAAEMADYIRQQSEGFVSPASQPMGWGTIAEIRYSIELIKKELNEKGIDEKTERVCVHISTNTGHMFRVQLYWWALAPKEWRVIFVPANHSFTMKEWFQETAKVVRDLFRIATGKIKRTET